MVLTAPNCKDFSGQDKHFNGDVVIHTKGDNDNNNIYYLYLCCIRKETFNMKIAESKIKAIGKAIGVTIKVDKSLDKFSNVVPDKMKENAKILANTKLSH